MSFAFLDFDTLCSSKQFSLCQKLKLVYLKSDMDVGTYKDIHYFYIVILSTTVAGAVLLIYFICDCGKTTKQGKTTEVIENGTKLTKKRSRTHFKPAKKAPAVFNHPYLHTTLKGHSAAVIDFDLSANGKYLATCSEDQSIRLWSIRDFGSGNKFALYNVKFDHAHQIQFSPDSRALLVGLSRNNTIRVVKLGKKEDGSTTTFTPLESDFPNDTKQTLMNVGIGLNAFGGSFVMTAYDDTTVKIRNVKGEVLHSINTNQGNNLHAAVSPCGRFVASAGWTPDVKVWAVEFDRGGNYQTVTRAFELKGHNSSVWSFDFSNDSNRMVTISKDGYWRFFDTQIEYEKGQEPYLLNSGKITVGSEFPTENACKIALSSDAKVAAVSCVTSITVFSTKTGKKEFEADGIHSMKISSLSFDLGGRYILTAGDRHIRVFYNTLGYKETIRDLEEKVKKPNITSATQERMKKQIGDARKALSEIEKRKKD